MKMNQILFVLTLAPLVICFFYVLLLMYFEKKHEKRECKDLSDWILQKKKLEKTEIEKELDRLIKSTKGKFFSVSFKQKDGSIKKFNGKNFYKRLQFDNMNSFGFVDPNKKTFFKNQKKGGWHNELGEIIQFKCSGSKIDFVTFDKIFLNTNKKNEINTANDVF